MPGKSSVAQQLAARINIPNVMQTDVLCELLRCGEAPSLARQPLWARTDLAGPGGGGPGGVGGGGDAALLAEFKRECRVVRQAMQGDLVKVGFLGGVVGWRDGSAAPLGGPGASHALSRLQTLLKSTCDEPETKNPCRRPCRRCPTASPSSSRASTSTPRCSSPSLPAQGSSCCPRAARP
jgi:hypothetical protein